jgi:FkbM family methyltransferase
MTSTTTLSLVDGVRVVVPESLEVLSSCVLREQEDWFEDEIKFLRRVLQPGEQSIDIGANCGVYALSMARAVGPTGRVWAFEPASGAARLLADGIAANGFSQVTLEQSAVSSACGTARLSLGWSSEVNSLVHDQAVAGATETVALTTLDDCLRRHRWQTMDVVKIDAEGEEANILAGGREFFRQLSPLVQYEIVDAQAGSRDLVREFAELGYQIYRLVPGLDLLVPYVADPRVLPGMLNLFACKRDRAEVLAARGLLTQPGGQDSASRKARAFNILETTNATDRYSWRNTIAKMPYGIALADFWAQTVARGSSAEVEAALALYAISRDPSLSPGRRFEALEAAFCLLDELCMAEPVYLRLSSVARVARDFGARRPASGALNMLSNLVIKSNSIPVGEPFLAPGERFDSIPPGESLGDWVLAAVLEELERLEHFSSYYAGAAGRARLETIRELGYGSAEMNRRLELARRRYG